MLFLLWTMSVLCICPILMNSWHRFCFCFVYSFYRAINVDFFPATDNVWTLNIRYIILCMLVYSHWLPEVVVCLTKTMTLSTVCLKGVGQLSLYKVGVINSVQSLCSIWLTCVELLSLERWHRFFLAIDCAVYIWYRLYVLTSELTLFNSWHGFWFLIAIWLLLIYSDWIPLLPW